MATIFLDMTVNVLSHITYRLTISIHFLKKKYSRKICVEFLQNIHTIAVVLTVVFSF